MGTLIGSCIKEGQLLCISLRMKYHKTIEYNYKIGIMSLKDQSEISRALSLYEKVLFWEYSEREIQFLPPEFVIPRITRYGSLKDVIRLFCIYDPEKIMKIVNSNKELDSKEKLFLMNLSKHATAL